MNLTQVRYFLAVAETGSFTRAADRLHVTQPTLSAGVRRLEDWLGASLFERGRRVRLTAAGLRFQVRARVILEESRAARAEVAAAPVPRRIRLGVLRTLPTVPLARLVAGLARAYPDLAPELTVEGASALQARLDQGRLDAVLTLLGEDDSGPTVRPLFREPFLVAAPPDHLLARRGRCGLRELHGQPFIIRPDCEMQSAAQQLFLAHGVRPRIVHRSGNDERTMALVAAGLGLALVPQSLLTVDVAAVAVAEIDFSRRIGLRWHQPASEATEHILDFAASHDWGGPADRRGDGRLAIAH